MKSSVFLIRTRSNLHCGTGRGFGDIDQPIARDSVTGFPIIPGASIKGVLRAWFGRNGDPADEKLKAAFGEAEKKEIDYASAVSFGDARLLCLPVRSYFGTFAWLTSPAALAPFRDGLSRAGSAPSSLPAIPVFEVDPGSYKAALPKETRLISSENEEQVLLEDLDLLKDSGRQEEAQQWAGILASLLYPGEEESRANLRNLFLQRFAIADDNVLSFLAETALPVVARTRIDGESGTVAPGALWYEEYVPAETVFFGSIDAGRGYGRYDKYSDGELLRFITGSRIDCQVGGNATTGQGNVTITFGCGNGE